MREAMPGHERVRLCLQRVQLQPAHVLDHGDRGYAHLGRVGVGVRVRVRVRVRARVRFRVRIRVRVGARARTRAQGRTSNPNPNPNPDPNPNHAIGAAPRAVGSGSRAPRSTPPTPG